MSDRSDKGARTAESKKGSRTATFGRYRIEREIGAGGMGTVYRAIDSQLNRTVALKVLPKEKARNELLVLRFKSEGKAAAALRHENLVCVFDNGEIDGSLYIAMEFVDGIDGQDLVMRDGPLDVERSLKIIKQVARGLEHAFQHQIVHRDIKPSNLLIDAREHVKLADFGLARSLDEEEATNITRAGTTVGTVDYMPPEQARNSKDADFRSDIYALGATWYFLLVGKPPFPEGDVLNKLNQHANDPPPDPRKFNPEIPVGVVDIIHKMLAKAQKDRYQTPTELLDDLNRVNLSEREINYDLIASLGGEDDDEPRRKSRSKEPEERVLKSSSRNRNAKATRTEQRPSKGERAESRDERPSRGDERQSRREPERAQSRSAKERDKETRSERDSTTAAESSPRDTSTRSLRRQRHNSVNVSFDSKKLITIGVAIIGVIVLLVVGSSLFKQAQQQIGQPGGGTSIVPQTIEMPSEPLKRNRPEKLGE